ncbi:thioesterase family protein [Ammoniphilus sp. YIM 78166]|uniref:thioesterase family protein n=1 Tax=Ammoniphilus sp. YIM 78166 TaxID=1644106 RepID=UPI00106F92E3|nr:hotdog domain-containing protein [Ammoniphilus sp. YIM 78166]
MKDGLKPGVQVEFKIVVDESMRPSFDGQVVHDVLSTVTMVYYMEKAGREVILPYLDESEEGAGYGLDIKHVGPAVVGQEVRFQAICTEVTEKRVVCEVTAETEWNVVGKGTFTQAIFQKKEMAQRLADLMKKATKV